METLKAVFLSGGWVIVAYAIFRIIIWVIRKTESKKDDVILDEYVAKAVKLSLQVIPNPENTQVNWLKFLGNALAEFNRAYTKEQGEAPDTSTYEKAKNLIIEIANNAQFANAKEMLEDYLETEEMK